MRQIGLAVIASMIQAPCRRCRHWPRGTTWRPAKPHDHVWLAPWLRNATEDMRALMRAYRRERTLGREHPEWFAWVKTYVDWLVTQQREDGSFPRRWKPGSNEVEEPSGTTSYAPVPLLVLLYRRDGRPEIPARGHPRGRVRVGELGHARALHRRRERQPEHHRQGSRDAQHGGVPEPLRRRPRIRRWLERAQAAADFAESWIWIWNLPMPLDADDSQLHWKKGVPTIGLQGITALGAGGTDEYLDWSVPFLREAVPPHERRALPRCGARAAPRDEVDAGPAGAAVRPEGAGVAAGALAHGPGRPGPWCRVPPALVALGLREPPLRHHGTRGVRPGVVQDAIRENRGRGSPLTAWWDA